MISAVLVALAGSLILTLSLLRATGAGRLLTDVPNERSSHASPKPRGGGVGVIGGFLLGVAAVFGGPALHPGALVLVAAATACAGLGLWDDLRGLSVGPRLAVEALAAACLVAVTGPLLRLPLPAPLDFPLGVLGFVFPVVWLVGVTNFFNFMDGIDGLAAGQGLAVCLLVAAAGWSSDASSLALLLGAGLVGFLPFNWWPARIFLGDVGSLSIGFLLAGFPLLAAPKDRGAAVLATATGLTPFLLDPVVTLWRRWRRGAPLGQPHREHAYQQLLNPADPHARVSASLIGAGVVLSVAGWAAYRWPPLAWPSVMVAALVFGIELFLAKQKART